MNFYDEMNHLYNKHRLTNLPGRELLEDKIKSCFTEGRLTYTPNNDEKEFPFTVETLEYFEHLGFRVIIDSGLVSRMSKTLSGARWVTIEWNDPKMLTV